VDEMPGKDFKRMTIKMISELKQDTNIQPNEIRMTIQVMNE
jgi:hypothetical protein